MINHESLDVKKLSLADLASAARMLSLSSALWIGGMLVALATAGFGLGTRFANSVHGAVKTASDSLATELAKIAVRDSVVHAFGDFYAEQVVDSQVLNALTDAFAREKPDGRLSREELERSLAWQLLAFRGTARVYRADSLVEVTLAHRDGAILMNWTHRSSELADALRRIGARPDELSRINARMNRVPFAELGGGHVVVRTPNGITIVSPQ